MKSKVAERMLAKMPEDVEIFVDKYADIVVRINQILKDKKLSQKELAEGMNKKPSEISKWLTGEHNFTLRSIAKLEAELGETILYVPRRISFPVDTDLSVSMDFYKNDPVPADTKFNKLEVQFFSDANIKRDAI